MQTRLARCVNLRRLWSLSGCGYTMRGLSSASEGKFVGHCTTGLVTVECLEGKDEGVSIVRLNAPDKLNAMNPEMGEAFWAAVQDLKRNPGLKGVVVGGVGRVFSVGADMKYIEERCADTYENNIKAQLQMYKYFLSIRELDVPVLCAMHGAAIAGGMCLALMCDYRYSIPRNKIGLTSNQVGLHPGMGATHFLPKLLRNDFVFSQLMQGEMLESDHAVRLGIISQLSDDPVDCALKFIRALPPSPTGLRLIVRTLRNQQEVGLEQALQREAEAQAQCFASHEVRANVKQSLETLLAKQISKHNLKHRADPSVLTRDN